MRGYGGLSRSTLLLSYGDDPTGHWRFGSDSLLHRSAYIAMYRCGLLSVSSAQRIHGA